jgi:PTH1 family peptidyl-tRNA hydrolase
VAKVKLGDEDILVLKPQTFMNRSGDSVLEAMRFYKLGVEDLVVVYDELDIPPMSYRIKKGGGPGGHNGIKSLLPAGDGFVRVRLGIGRPPHPSMDVAAYVLGNLGKEELEYWEREMPHICEAIDLCLSGKTEVAMNRFNRKSERAPG